MRDYKFVHSLTSMRFVLDYADKKNQEGKPADCTVTAAWTHDPEVKMIHLKISGPFFSPMENVWEPMETFSPIKDIRKKETFSYSLSWGYKFFAMLGMIAEYENILKTLGWSPKDWKSDL